MYDDSVYIAPEVNRDNISPEAKLLPGTRIFGADTSIGPGCVISAEGPTTLKNVQLGENVILGGGYLEKCVLLDGAGHNDGAHIRPGCLLEEQVHLAHTVGLKQTILMPFVELGSLINFCDVLMAGGTSSKNHSEVGSSYIHFNFTPHQDKATASLIGDVPRGVLLREKPIFLGGQGGMVGPRRIAYGTTIAAGSILRHDVLKENQLVQEVPKTSLSIPYDGTLYGRVDGIVANCLAYLDALIQLHAWYVHARSAVFQRTPWHQACLKGAIQAITTCWEERIKRLDQLQQKLLDANTDAQMSLSSAVYATQRDFCTRWPLLKPHYLKRFEMPAAPGADAQKQIASLASAESYLAGIRALSPQACRELSAWLECC